MSRPNSSDSQHGNGRDDYNEHSEDIGQLVPGPDHGQMHHWRLIPQEIENHDHDYLRPMVREPMENANILRDAHEEGAVGGIPLDDELGAGMLLGNMPQIIAAPRTAATGAGTSDDEEGAVGGNPVNGIVEVGWGGLFGNMPQVAPRAAATGIGIANDDEEGAVGGTGYARIVHVSDNSRTGVHIDYNRFPFAEHQPLYALVTRPSMAEGPLDLPPGVYHRCRGHAHAADQLGMPVEDVVVRELSRLFSNPSTPSTSSSSSSSAREGIAAIPGSNSTPTTAAITQSAPSGVITVVLPADSSPGTSAASANTASTSSPNRENSAHVSVPTRTPTGKRKRVKMEASQAGTPKLSTGTEEEQEEGLICPICLDAWEMSGEHRLVSLKCGHLFGESCIRRWLNECTRQGSQKVCPQCKAKGKLSEIRHLYAKRLRAIDRTEEHDLRRQLEEEKLKRTDLTAEISRLKMTLTMFTTKIDALVEENERMKQTISRLSANRELAAAPSSQNPDLPLLRLSLERNVELSVEPGSRVMVFSKVHASLLVSQKSGMQGLFPGYGLRILETTSFRPVTFIHTSGKYLRDLSLSHDESLVAVASMEPRVKLFDVRTNAFNAVIMPNDKALWSCAFGRTDRDNTVFVGAQHGSTFVYDTRFPENVLEEYQEAADISPIINIAPIAANPQYPYGGFLVCKMQSLWFYEFCSAGYDAKATRLSSDGPFVSMNYDAVNENILLYTRTNSRNPTSRYIFGKLDKVVDTPTFTEISVFLGSKTVPVMTRCSQIVVDKNVLIASYVQDEKKLTLFDTGRQIRTQSVPIQSVVYDNCPISNAEGNFLAALTETKLRIYKLTSQGPKS